MLNLQLLEKYKDKIKEHIKLLQMSDETLRESIFFYSKLIVNYSEDIKHLAKDGNIYTIGDKIVKLRSDINLLDSLIKEALTREKIQKVYLNKERK